MSRLTSNTECKLNLFSKSLKQLFQRIDEASKQQISISFLYSNDMNSS